MPRHVRLGQPGETFNASRMRQLLPTRPTTPEIAHPGLQRRLTSCGTAVVMPPVPAFYIGGESMERFLDHYCMRIADRLGLELSGTDELRWP